jgi:hypothetical protein
MFLKYLLIRKKRVFKLQKNILFIRRRRERIKTDILEKKKNFDVLRNMV